MWEHTRNTNIGLCTEPCQYFSNTYLENEPLIFSLGHWIFIALSTDQKKARGRKERRRWGFTHLLLATFFKPLQKQAHTLPQTHTSTHGGSNTAHTNVVHCQCEISCSWALWRTVRLIAKPPFQNSNYHENGWEPTMIKHTDTHTPERATTPADNKTWSRTTAMWNKQVSYFNFDEDFIFSF